MILSTFTNGIVNSSPRAECWRLSYAGTQICELVFSDDITSTGNSLFCATTLEEIDAKIQELGLTWPDGIPQA